MIRRTFCLTAALTIPLWTEVQKGNLAIAQAPPPKPKISVSYEDRPDKVITLVGIAVPIIPDFECDVWCYESEFDNKGRGEAEAQPDDSMILTHTRGPTTVKTHIVPGIIPASDAGSAVAYVDFFITVSGKTKDDIMALTTVNPCWQMKRAPGFRSEDDYVKDFANQCFMFTEKGLTMLSETTRFPDTRKPLDDRVNTPPWVQNYPPVWLRHPGQRPNSRGIGVDRPIYTLAGEISRDGKYLVAMGCRRGSRVGQVWHDCLHLSPDLRDEYDEAANELRARWRMYFMGNDPDRLLRMYLADIKPPVPAVSVEAKAPDGPLAISSSDLPAQSATLALRIAIDGQVALIDAAHQWQKQIWGAVTGGGSGPKGRYYVWANPVADHIDLVVSVANTSQDKIDARIEAMLDLADPSGLAAAGGVASVLWEDGDAAALGITPPKRITTTGALADIARGEFKTLRGRVHLTKSTPAVVDETMAEDLAEWDRTVPFKRALPE